MADEIQKTALRIPKELHQKIHELADKSGRSMNAEIVHRLGESVELTERLENLKQEKPISFIDPSTLTKDSARKEMQLTASILIRQAAALVMQISNEDPGIFDSLPETAEELQEHLERSHSTKDLPDKPLQEPRKEAK
jgi:predicted DNA-binding protein